MSDIGAIRSTTPAAVPPAGAAKPAATPPSASRAAERLSDRVEFSQASRILGKLADLPVRSDLVARVRQQIQDGTYETSDKLDAAVENLSQDLT